MKRSDEHAACMRGWSGGIVLGEWILDWGGWYAGQEVQKRGRRWIVAKMRRLKEGEEDG
jgi:hypothetical protein